MFLQARYVNTWSPVGAIFCGGGGDEVSEFSLTEGNMSLGLVWGYLNFPLIQFTLFASDFYLKM